MEKPRTLSPGDKVVVVSESGKNTKTAYKIYGDRAHQTNPKTSVGYEGIITWVKRYNMSHQVACLDKFVNTTGHWVDVKDLELIGSSTCELISKTCKIFGSRARDVEEIVLK